VAEGTPGAYCVSEYCRRGEERAGGTEKEIPLHVAGKKLMQIGRRCRMLSDRDTFTKNPETNPYFVKRPSFEDAPDILTAEDILRILPIGRSTLYQLLRSEELPAKKLGRKYLVSKKALQRWLEEW
jgi:excisionase family DNA binding protein